MRDERYLSLRHRGSLGFRLAATASGLALLIGLSAAPAAAQSVIYSGASDSVTVNNSVLDQLGPGGSPTYGGQGSGATYTEPGYGNFPPQQMPRSFSNLNNLAPQSSPGIRTTQSATPQPATSQTGQSGVPQAPQPSQAAAPQQPAPQGPEPTYTAAPQQPQGTSASANLTPTQRLQQQQGGGQTGASADSATAAASAPEDMSSDPAATREDEAQAAPSSAASEPAPPETEMAEAVEPPPTPESATPESDATAESADQMQETESESAAEGESMATDAAAEEVAAPEPPPAPEPPEAPASATPEGEPPAEEPAETATAADTAEPEAESAADAEQPEAAEETTEAADAGDSGDSGDDDASAQEPQQAALTTGAGPMQGGTLRVVFETAESDLPEDIKPQLKALAQQLLQEEATRIQLLAYADGDSSESSRARRLSLARALEVRGYLIDQGIRSTRMDVRALGNNVPDGPPDRVDIQAAVR